MNIHDDLEHLDRMVDGNAAKDETRFQIRLVQRQVTALETEYAALAESHSQLKEEHAKLHETHTKLIATNKERDAQAWNDAVRRNQITEDYS